MPDNRNLRTDPFPQCSPDSLLQGEIVEVQGIVYRKDSTDQPDFDPETWVTQRFVAFHNNVFYCERDDGERHVLIGWNRCRKKRHNAPYYYKDEPIESDVHYVKS